MIQQSFKAMTSVTPTNSPAVSRIFLTGLIAGLIAMVLNSLAYGIGRWLNGGALMVVAGPEQLEAIPLAAILGFSFFPSLIAAVLFLFLQRLTPFPKAIFLAIASIVLIVFAFGPINAASTMTTMWILQAMHLIAAVPIVQSLLSLRKAG